MPLYVPLVIVVCMGVVSLVPIPPLPLTKWPQKGWSGIFVLGSSSHVILANQIAT